MKSQLRGFLPGVAVLLAVLVAVRLVDDVTLDLVARRYALVLYAAGSILAGAFHRSRAVLALLGLGCVELASTRASLGADPLVPLGTLLLGLFAALALVRDRSVFSRAGITQLATAAIVGTVGVATFDTPSSIESFESAPLLPIPFHTTAFPDVTVCVAAFALAAAVIGVYRWRGPIERGLLSSQVVVLLALHPSVGPSGAGVLLMAAGLLMALSVVQTSYAMAYRDELTDLPGRRALVHYLEEIGGTYAIAMVDVDHFKKFNDKHGHDVGDQVLKLVASRLAAGPGGGKAYRYGGEEFTLVYPGRVRDDAIPHLEAVRASIESASFSLRSKSRPKAKPKEGEPKPKPKARVQKLSVTVSMGVADSTESGATPDSVLEKADEALYRAKRGGRNRVSK